MSEYPYEFLINSIDLSPYIVNISDLRNIVLLQALRHLEDELFWLMPRSLYYNVFFLGCPIDVRVIDADDERRILRLTDSFHIQRWFHFESEGHPMYFHGVVWLK